MLNNLNLKQLTLLTATILLGAGITVSAGITYLNSEINQVKRVWQEFQAERGDKARILVRLQAVLGYGGMIHDFKNLVLRKDLAQIERVHTQLGAADDLLANLRSLSLDRKEVEAAKAIESVLGAYELALHIAEQAIQQGRSSSDIDSMVKVDDRPAFKGLAVLRELNLSRRHEYVSGVGKWILASDLRASLGYGGMIHSYKNYLLRHDDEYFYRAMDKITQVYQQVSSYRALSNTSEESVALDQLLITIQTYQASLEKARLLVKQGMEIESIDRKIKIDDGPAINALNNLSREIYYQLETKSEHVLNSLNTYQELGIWIVFFTLLVIIVLVSVCVWILVFSIARPISRMSIQMYSLAGGNTDIEIEHQQQKNEIGSMARAVETFRQNAITQLVAEQSLGNVNSELEKNLSELSLMKDKSDQQVEESKVLADRLYKASDDAFSASKRAEEQKERANAIINSVSDAIISIDDASNIITFNSAAEEIFGYQLAEVLGKDLSMLMPNPHRASHHQYVDNYHKSGESKLLGYLDKFGQRRELPALRKNGEVFPMEISIGETKVGGRRMYIGV
ncbi:MAG: PAS domain S-box protein, partial [Gammaproteobacteria bacterium]|nr:PAS domain S-box protein [Gammaproteobacteria bacterium]